MNRIDTPVLLLFAYGGWFSIVGLAVINQSLISFLVPGALIVFLSIRKILTWRYTVLSIAIAVMGALLDLLMHHFGLIIFQNTNEFFIPAWLVSLWILFSFSTLKLVAEAKIPFWIWAVMGGIFGPLSYKSGENFGLLTFSHPSTFFVYAVLWAIAFPLIVLTSRRTA